MPMEDIEPAPAPEPVTPEPVTEPAPEPVTEPAPEPVTEPAPERKRKGVRQDVASTVASDMDPVTVSMSALVVRGWSRNSASVKALQDRLSERGYHDWISDGHGWISDATVRCLASFQSEHGLDPSGIPDRATVDALMQGTPVVIAD